MVTWKVCFPEYSKVFGENVAASNFKGVRLWAHLLFDYPFLGHLQST